MHGLTADKGAWKPLLSMSNQGRWSSSRMASRCTRNEQAGEALQYL
ncbi:MAG: hypothetical protein OXD44_01655 [Gammaproteobacteria bacterium]|nr:hypothetical protein [Gammaproteobacteria bacterium]MCY4312403.1 hypothetical protein [Gammaproteobacteria bacterium]